MNSKTSTTNSNIIKKDAYAIQPPYENDPGPIIIEEDYSPIYFDERKTSTVILDFLFALLLPPLSVYRTRGCGCCLTINLLLCMLCWIPGIIHAVILSCM